MHWLVLPLTFAALYLSIWVVLFHISNGFFTKNSTAEISYFGGEYSFIFLNSVVDCRAPGGSFYTTSYCASTNLFGSCTSYENQYFGGGGGGIGQQRSAI